MPSLPLLASGDGRRNCYLCVEDIVKARLLSVASMVISCVSAGAAAVCIELLEWLQALCFALLAIVCLLLAWWVRS